MTAIRQKIGRVGLRPRGTWTNSPSEPYMTMDVVDKDGSSYMSKVDNNTSIPPSDSWQINSQRGESGRGVPIGGTTGQVLKKKSNEDFDTEWSSDNAPVTSVNNKTGNVTLNANDVNALPSSTKYGRTINMSLDSTTYILTLSLIDQDGIVLNTKTVDLPIESVVVNGRYDAINKKIVLTLQSGSTIDVPVGDLVAGLQTEITALNMLDADLVDDTNATHKFVTAQEKTTWNNKSDFSGSYNDLTDKPTIPSVPTDVSAFNNDSGYITKTVNDLVNYYLKSDTYTKTEVQQLISAIQQFTYQVVSSLPTASADTMNIIYLVPSDNPQTQNVKDEYITIDNGASATTRYTWEQIGSTAIDLSGYYTSQQTDAAITTALNTALADYTTTSALTLLLAAKQDVISDLATIRSGAAAGATAVQPAVIADMEVVSNKVTSLSAQSTDVQYPSAKCVYDMIGNIETLLAAI